MRPLLSCTPSVCRWVNSWADGTIEDLVDELAVRVLPEQSLTHRGSGGVLEELQSGLESVVNLDLSLSANNDDATRTIVMLAIVFMVSKYSRMHVQ